MVAIGNPFGLDRTVTAGIVSALQRRITAPNNYQIDHVIQTDAAINHGNSGGPLLNAQGQVIGVNAQIQTGGSTDGNVGVGFAIPINTVKTVVAEIDPQRPRRARLHRDQREADRAERRAAVPPPDRARPARAERPARHRRRQGRPARRHDRT